MLQGLNYPLAAYAFHAVKLVLLVLGWMYFCRFTPGLGTFTGFTTWVFADVAFGYVVPIMTANNPLLKSPALRRRLFVSYPDDLTP